MGKTEPIQGISMKSSSWVAMSNSPSKTQIIFYPIGNENSFTMLIITCGFLPKTRGIINRTGEQEGGGRPARRYSSWLFALA